MSKERTLLYVIYGVVGGALCAAAWALELNSFWSGLGFALLCIAAARLVCIRRLKAHPEKAAEAEREAKDERNLFLMDKARSWAFAWGLILAGAAVVVLQLVRLPAYSYAVAYVLCGQLVLYWVCWLVLRKKY